MCVVEQLGHLRFIQHHLIRRLEVVDVLKVQTACQESEKIMLKETSEKMLIFATFKCISDGVF